MTTRPSHTLSEVPPVQAVDAKSHLPPPTVASPGRQVFHTVLAGAGWVLFVYWWWLVFHHLSHREVRFTLLFIAISFALCVAGTGAWVLHNRAIYLKRGLRTGSREAELDYSRDPLGRSVTYEAPPQALLEAPVVRVLIDPERKLYRPVRPGGSKHSAA